MSGPASTVRIRKSETSVDVVSLEDVRLRMFDAAVPWREFRWYRKQRHFSGSYWSATMEAHVGYESRLEYANLLLADFDPRVEWILSQPFLLEGDDRGKLRRHIPDYLLAHADKSVCVVDVKPAEKLSLPKVRDSLAWSRRVFEKHGWEYRVQSEPDPVVFANAQFLAGYRRRFQFVDAEVAAATDELRIPQTFGEAVRAVTPITGDPRFARSLVLHLLWTRRLRTDLSQLLSTTSLLEPT
ncbi:TnsA-like heteromeric transposase endonuclease subunit [Microbacterium aurantiacum]|uniref:TnsA-like heteromeric transposase endonuclease subunit n=1 Tax=Microbacterium aurantiacum TaxID=162393 RepID=UPI00342B6429